MIDPDVRKVLDERLATPDDDALIERVKSRVMEAVRAETPNRTVRCEEGWEPLAPGVERKWLWSAGDVRSCMMRFAAGGAVPAHLHEADEECVVLEGTVRFGDDIELHAGDFHVGRKGSAHGVASTDTGAVVYLRGVFDC